MFLLIIFSAVLLYAIADIRKYTYSSGIKIADWFKAYWVPAAVAMIIALFAWLVLPLLGSSPAELAEPVGFFAVGIVLMHWAKIGTK